MDTNSSQNNSPMNNPGPHNPSPMQMWLVPGSILLAGIIIAAAVVGTLIYTTNKQAANSATTQPTVSGQPVAQPADITKITTSGEPYIGNPNAPVTIAYWSDYQCPFCMQFELGTLESIIKDYVTPGKVKVVFKDFPFLGPDSTADALYARAVWSLYPSQFFAWRTALFTAQPEENSLSTADNTAHLQKITASIPGIDAAKIAQAVAANTATYTQEINADQSEGSTYGVTGTPSFIIGTQLLSGAPGYSDFQTLINAQLK